MILYHGSNVAIDEIDLSKLRPGKDFGKGFYLSADKQQAIGTSVPQSEKNGNVSQDKQTQIQYRNRRRHLLSRAQLYQGHVDAACGLQLHRQGGECSH